MLDMSNGDQGSTRLSIAKQHSAKLVLSIRSARLLTLMSHRSFAGAASFCDPGRREYLHKSSAYQSFRMPATPMVNFTEPCFLTAAPTSFNMNPTAVLFID
jgi:hypothetical protein